MNWLAKLGNKLGLPELGISELLQGDTRAYDLAKENAAMRAAGAKASGVNPALSWLTPNTYGGQDFYNAATSAMPDQTMYNKAEEVQNRINAEAEAKAQAEAQAAAKAQAEAEAAAAIPKWTPKYYNGVLYTDENSYINAVNDTINTNYQKGVASLQKLLDAGLIDTATMEEGIKSNRESLKKQLDTAMRDTSGYFNRISSDASQSQQKTYENKNTEAYNTGMQQVGSDIGKSIKDLSPEEINKYSNELSNVGTAVRSYRDLKNNINDQRQNLDIQKSNALTNFGNETLANYTNAQGVQNTAGAVKAMSPINMAYKGFQNGDMTSGVTGYTNKDEYDYFGNKIRK